MDKNKFNAQAFYAALDAQRTAKRLSWRQVAQETNVNASTLTRIGQGKLPDVDNFAMLVLWLGVDVEMFMYDKRKDNPETLTIISSHFHNDPRLSGEDAQFLSDIVSKMYTLLCKK